MDLMDLGQRVLASQPFSVLLGAEITRFEAGYADLGLPIKPEFLQQHGFVHGGVISYLADNAITFAGGSILGENVLTAEYKINYLRPATGQRLIARATVLHAGKRLVTCRCDVFALSGDNEKLCATAQGTIVNTNV